MESDDDTGKVTLWIRDRIRAVEKSTASAHKRIDEHEHEHVDHEEQARKARSSRIRWIVGVLLMPVVVILLDRIVGWVGL